METFSLSIFRRTHIFCRVFTHFDFPVGYDLATPPPPPKKKQNKNKNKTKTTTTKKTQKTTKNKSKQKQKTKNPQKQQQQQTIKKPAPLPCLLVLFCLILSPQSTFRLPFEPTITIEVCVHVCLLLHSILLSQKVGKKQNIIELDTTC